MLLAVPGLRCPAGFSLAVLSGPLQGGGLPVRRGLAGTGLRALRQWAQQLRPPGSAAQTQCPWPTGSAALRHVGSSRTRGQTLASCTGRGFFTSEPTRGALLDVFVRNFCVYVPDGSWCLVFFFVCVCVSLPWCWFWSDPHLIEYSGKHSVFFSFLKVFVRNWYHFFPEMCGRIHHWNHLDLESFSWKISFPESSVSLINVSLFRLFFLLIFVNLCVS